MRRRMPSPCGVTNDHPRGPLLATQSQRRCQQSSARRRSPTRRGATCAEMLCSMFASRGDGPGTRNGSQDVEPQSSAATSLAERTTCWCLEGASQTIHERRSVAGQLTSVAPALWASGATFPLVRRLTSTLSRREAMTRDPRIAWTGECDARAISCSARSCTTSMPPPTPQTTAQNTTTKRRLHRSFQLGRPSSASTPRISLQEPQDPRTYHKCRVIVCAIHISSALRSRLRCQGCARAVVVRVGQVLKSHTQACVLPAVAEEGGHTLESSG